MIRFKNNHGFTLIEAMIAIAIVGMVLTPMFILETNVFTTVSRLGERFHRLLFAKNFLYAAQQQEPMAATDYSLEKKEDRPITMVRYNLKPISKESSLSKLNFMFKQQVIADGIHRDSPSAAIVQFLYKPKEGA